MATTITKLYPSGLLQSSVAFDEISYQSIKVGPGGVYAAQFDEINLPSGTAERRLSNGTYQVSGYFDEYTPLELPPLTLELLIVAGGGGGGFAQGGAGGGAGGLLYYGTEAPKTPNGPAITPASGMTFDVTIGAGGASQVNALASNGTDSIVNSYIAIGGGGAKNGGGSTGQGAAGGSGGGSCASTVARPTGGTGVAGQGYAGGGCSVTSGSQRIGGGGGGAGGPGGYAEFSVTAGQGGIGCYYSISGASVGYAGGGAGGTSAPTPAAAATGFTNLPNTGGGGNKRVSGTDTTGASGLVVFRISDAYTMSFTDGLTVITNTDIIGYNIYSVIAGIGTATIN